MLFAENYIAGLPLKLHSSVFYVLPMHTVQWWQLLNLYLFCKGKLAENLRLNLCFALNLHWLKKKSDVKTDIACGTTVTLRY